MLNYDISHCTFKLANSDSLFKFCQVKFHQNWSWEWWYVFCKDKLNAIDTVYENASFLWEFDLVEFERGLQQILAAMAQSFQVQMGKLVTNQQKCHFFWLYILKSRGLRIDHKNNMLFCLYAEKTVISVITPCVDQELFLFFLSLLFFYISIPNFKRFQKPTFLYICHRCIKKIYNLW